MLVALAIALSSIALGAVIGLLPGSSRRTGNPFQTFAMVMSTAVVLGQLLPEALAAVGFRALFAFGLGFGLPRLGEWLAGALRRPACVHDDAVCTDLGLELGYGALLLHHVGDGVGLGLYTSPLHRGHNHYDVLAALAAHTVPLTALVVLAFRTHRGALDAGLRAVGIALCTMLGLGLANLLSAQQLAVWEPWLTALVGGLLLHVVAHGWPTEDPVPPLRSRVLDLAAVLAGVALLAFGGEHGHSHLDEPAEVSSGMSTALVGLSLRSAPLLLLGLGLAALLQKGRTPRALGGDGRLRGAWAGLLSAATCAHVRDDGDHLAIGRDELAASEERLADGFARPALGMETLVLSAGLFGWSFALLRLAGAGLVAVAGARAGASSPLAGHAAAGPLERDLHPRGAVGWLGRLDALFDHEGAWIVAGLIAAAYVDAAWTFEVRNWVTRWGLDVLLLSALALPSRACAVAVVPVAAVLLEKGVSTAGVATALLLAPALHQAPRSLEGRLGARARRWVLVAMVGAAWIVAASIGWVLPIGGSSPASAIPRWVETASAAVLAMLLVRAVLRRGLPAFFRELGSRRGLVVGPVRGAATGLANEHGAAHAAAHEGRGHSHAHHDHAHHDHAPPRAVR